MEERSGTGPLIGRDQDNAGNVEVNQNQRKREIKGLVTTRDRMKEKEWDQKKSVDEKEK